MKVMLTAVNARYVHTNLAIRYLAEKVKAKHEVLVREYTINHYPQDLLQHIYEEQPDVVGFSCYIWNVEQVLRIVSSLKKVNPETIIILGGPEVSYDGSQLMKQNDCIDFIIAGEGEIVLSNLLDALEQNEDYTSFPGISYRIRGQVYSNEVSPYNVPVHEIPIPYPSDLHLENNRIYYYETSRGCPFRCQFCLSGNHSEITMLPLDRVYSELQILIDQRVKQVKFVDRTFNADPERALSIMRHLKKVDQGVTNFHFEINASLITQDMMAFLETVPKGLFQFEIGIQSTNADTLKAISRLDQQEKAFAQIKQLKNMGNCHLHVDLIAGLPHEDYYRFRNSFNDVFGLQADMTQLGFLKLLKGSGIRRDHMRYEYVYQDHPPYEVLENHKISFAELVRLKRIEDLLEKYWNSGKTRNAIQLALDLSKMDAFSFFEQFSDFWKAKMEPLQNVGQTDLMELMQSYLHQLLPLHHELIDAVLRYDYCLMGQQKQLPATLQLPNEKQETMNLHDLLHSADFRNSFFPELKDLPAKKILPYVKSLAMPKVFSVRQQNELYISGNLLEWNGSKTFIFIYPYQKLRNENMAQVVDMEDMWDENSIHETGKD